MVEDAAAGPNGNPARKQGITAWITSQPAAALSVIGVLLFGANRYAYDLYYRSLGSSPEDVGLGYAQILSQTAAGFLVTAVTTFVLVTMYWLFMAVQLHSLRFSFRGLSALVRALPLSWPKRVLFLLLVLALTLALGGASIWLVERFAPAWLEVALVVASVGALVVVTVRDATRDRRRHVQSPTTPMDTRAAHHDENAASDARPTKRAREFFALWISRRALLACAVMATLVTILLTIGNAGNAVNVAQDADKGDGRPDVGAIQTLLTQILFNGALKPRSAVVTLMGDSETTTPSQCLLYMGSANGVSVFYEPESEKGVRIPNASIRVEVSNSVDC